MTHFTSMTKREIHDELYDALVDAQGSWVPAFDRDTLAPIKLRLVAPGVGEGKLYAISVGKTPTRACEMSIDCLWHCRLRELPKQLEPKLLCCYFILEDGDDTRLLGKMSGTLTQCEAQASEYAGKYPGARVRVAEDLPNMSVRSALFFGGDA